MRLWASIALFSISLQPIKSKGIPAFFRARHCESYPENVVNTFLNQRVRLTNGLEGNIIFINPVALSKPTIKIGDKFLDLKAVDNVEIEKII